MIAIHVTIINVASKPKRINRNINSEPHSFADARVKKTLSRTDMRQRANDRNREELYHLFRLEILQKHPPERIQQKRLKINNMQY